MTDLGGFGAAVGGGWGAPAARGQEDDALYGGFTSQPAAVANPLTTPGTGAGAGFMPTGSTIQRPPPSQGGNWGWGAQTPGGGAGLPTGGSMLKTMDTRPMTSNRASGFQGKQNGAASFDPLHQGHSLGPAMPLQKRADNSPEEQCLELEKRVNTLIEESAMLAVQKDYSLALEKAIEAAKKERWLCKEREKLGLGDQINIDLTYSVHFNLAVQYQNAQCYQEALNTYTLIVRNKQYAQSGRLRVNMGNIYYEQKKYPYAIKMYKMALDQVPGTGRDIRFRITRNIANAYVRLGQYQDAINHYEVIMKDSSDIQTGFNLLLCYYILRDKDRMKRQFLKLLAIKLAGVTEDDEEEDEHESDKAGMQLVEDSLLSELRERRKQHSHYILTAGRLIAPVIDGDWEKGFEFVVNSFKQTRFSDIKQPRTRLTSEMEMCWALQYLKMQKYDRAIECLKAFEKKDKTLKARAACNLSYLYFLEGDYENGDSYANMSVEADKYNARALVNKGNFLYVRKDYDKAKEYYLEALSVEADCIEALYNLGLATKALHHYEESLRVFKRLQTMVDCVEVTYQLANLYDLIGRHDISVEWFKKAPTDPAVFARLGTIFAREDDESQAFHYHLEAYRYLPVNMEVINWLGAYFVKNEVYEKAMRYFERAAQIQPAEVKWQLLVASCYRRIGAFPQAKKMYEDIHRRHPENAECPRYLVHLCKEMGLTDEAVAYHKVLAKLEKRQGISSYSPTGEGRNGEGTPYDNNQSADQEAPTNSRRAAEVAAMDNERDKDALQEEKEKKQRIEDDDELDDDDLPGM